MQPQQGVTGLPTAPTSLPSAVDTSDIVSLFLRGFPSMHLSIVIVPNQEEDAASLLAEEQQSSGHFVGAGCSHQVQLLG